MPSYVVGSTLHSGFPDPDEKRFRGYDAQGRLAAAINFFKQFGITAGEDNTLSTNLTPDQITSLSSWHNTTTPSPGIQMVGEDGFYRKVLLAVSLWRQRGDDGSINYLLGKGVGVEIALRGEVLGRQKRPVVFPYRSHSDFEIYGVDYERHTTNPYTPQFREVLGAQETRPLTETKGLRNIPPDLLHNTAEVVNLGGLRILVPQLELLFLDKFMSSESTPRPEGTDAKLLAEQYPLNRELILEYYDKFVSVPHKTGIESEDQEKTLQQQLAAISRNICWLKQENLSLEGAVEALNKRMGNLIATTSSVVYSGIEKSLWTSITPDQVDEEGAIKDQKFVENLRDKIKTRKQTRLDEAEMKRVESLQKIIELLDKAETVGNRATKKNC
ncbi:MAG: hypothetical protein V1744_00495 [Candidatus Altiarchaeota archaeon]